MQQSLQCIQQPQITTPRVIQESRLKVAGGHGEHVGALLLILCGTPQTWCIAVLRLSAVALYFCHLQMTRHSKRTGLGQPRRCQEVCGELQVSAAMDHMHNSSCLWLLSGIVQVHCSGSECTPTNKVYRRDREVGSSKMEGQKCVSAPFTEMCDGFMAHPSQEYHLDMDNYLTVSLCIRQQLLYNQKESKDQIGCIKIAILS